MSANTDLVGNPTSETPETPNFVTLHDGTKVEETDFVTIVTLYDGRRALHDDPNLIELHDGELAFCDDEEVVRLHTNGDYALQDEVTYCHGYNEYYLRDEATRYRGYWYSDDYLDENTFICDNCNERLWNDDYATDGLCSGCHDSEDEDHEEDDPYAVKGYSNRSADYMRPQGKGPLFYGIELEVECKSGVNYNDEAHRVYKALGTDYAVLKHDGSLSSSGFEIVTRPDALDIHKNRWAEFIKTSSSTLTSWTNGRCGMHIHATRSALTQLQLGKMLVWINHPSNESLVKTIAGRSLKQWACIETGKKLSDGKKLSPNRYVALNVRDETVEIRIFRGTLKPESFYKNMEFYDALIAFCAPSTHGIKDIETPAAFLRFVQTHRKTYPHLHEFLTRRHQYVIYRID
jgi:hypothetical protein